MDPVPMFVGDVDEARRHTVGVGLTLMEQPRHRQRRTTRDEKDNKGDDQEDDPWRTAARRGFHPVFDASFKRLILVVANGGGGGGGGVWDEEGDEGRTKIGPYPVELWDASMPRYSKEHYSLNAGVREMLQCIRSAQQLGDY